MQELVLTDVDDAVLNDLRERATRHGRMPVQEAKAILEEALRTKRPDGWEPVDAIYERLAASGRTFTDSADRQGGRAEQRERFGRGTQQECGRGQEQDAMPRPRASSAFDFAESEGVWTNEESQALACEAQILGNCPTTASRRQPRRRTR